MIDLSDIEKFEDWWARIEQLIVAADAVVFVISLDSIRSEVCEKELEFAASLHKRLAPILAYAIDQALIPEKLRQINYLVCGTLAAGLEDAAGELVKFVNSDIGWLREHTRIGELALRWEASRRASYLSLGGRSPPQPDSGAIEDRLPVPNCPARNRHL